MIYLIILTILYLRPTRYLTNLKQKAIIFFNEQDLKSLYFSLVRSNLEYCSLTWDPYWYPYFYTFLILQKLLFQFSRFTFFSSLQYFQFEIKTVIFFYEVCNNMIDSNNILNSLRYSVPNRSLRNPPCFSNISVHLVIFHMLFNDFKIKCSVFL